MEKKKDNEVSLKDAIKGFLQTFHLEGKFHEQQIKDIWGDVMGRTISHYTTSIRLREGALTITLNSAPLKQDLLFQKETIQKRQNDELGEYVVREVVIR